MYIIVHFEKRSETYYTMLFMKRKIYVAKPKLIGIRLDNDDTTFSKENDIQSDKHFENILNYP